MIGVNNASLFITGEDGITTPLAYDLSGTCDVTMSTHEDTTAHFDLHKSMDFSCDAHYINTPLIESMYGVLSPNVFTIQWNVKAMVQARWHKNARIRKKWLKRYGMKPDTVCFVGEAKTMSVDTEFNYELDITNLRYVLRPDQQRRGLKIEW